MHGDSYYEPAAFCLQVAQCHQTSLCHAEAQKKPLEKLMTQKSHSFTAGVKQTDSPAADYCPARRFDDIVPAVTRHDSAKMTDELYDSPKLKALQQKLRRQVQEDLVSSPAVSAADRFSPRINSSFGERESSHDELAGMNLSPVSSWEQKPQGQSAGKLVQQVMTHTVHTEATTIQHMPAPQARTHLATDSWGSEPDPTGAVGLNYQSQTAETHVLAEDVRVISNPGAGSVGQGHATVTKEVATRKVTSSGPAQMMNQVLGNRGQRSVLMIYCL